MEVTAWYDDYKRTKAHENISEVYYYMVHATSVEERRNWAVVYTDKLVNLRVHDDWTNEHAERYQVEHKAA